MVFRWLLNWLSVNLNGRRQVVEPHRREKELDASLKRLDQLMEELRRQRQIWDEAAVELEGMDSEN